MTDIKSQLEISNDYDNPLPASLVDGADNPINPAKEDGNLAAIKTVADKLQFDDNNNLQVTNFLAADRGDIYGWDIFPSGWVQLGGSLTPNDQVTITIDTYDSSYTIQAGDSWSNVVEGLANAINANSNINTKVDAFSQYKLVFIRGQEPGDKYDGLSLSTSVSGGATITATANDTTLGFHWKEILVEEDTNDRRYGRIGVFGDVSSITKANNPIHIVVRKNLATKNEIVFADKIVPANRVWYITNVAVADDMDGEFAVYHGLERDRTENFTGNGSDVTFTLNYNAVANSDYISVTKDGASADLGSDYTLAQNSNDETKTDITFHHAPSTSVSVTYDAVTVSLGLFVVGNTSQPFEFGTPIKLEEYEFIIVSVTNKSSNSGIVIANINGFYEETI